MIDFKYLLESLEHFQRNKKKINERLEKLVKQWEEEDEK